MLRRLWSARHYVFAMALLLVVVLAVGLAAVGLLRERHSTESADRAFLPVTDSTDGLGETSPHTSRTRPEEASSLPEATEESSKEQPRQNERTTGGGQIGDGSKGAGPRALAAEIQAIAEDHRGTYGVVVWQPSSGKRVALNASKSFEAASLAKLPVLLALYREAAAGRVDLDERIKIRSADVTSGTGTLKERPPGTALTLRDCAYHLVSESDNTAWSMLERRVTKKRVQAELESIEASSTNYEYADHSTTPGDVLRMLERISDPGYTSPPLSEEMLSAMTGTSFEDRIPQGVPEDALVAHKIGILGESFADAGVVYPHGKQKQRYYVVVLSENTTERSSREAIQEMSHVAYGSLASPEAGFQPGRP